MIVVLGAGRAHAQNAEAEALFADGNKLMAAGRIAEACEAFEASNHVEARAGTLIRLGDCREQNHQLASAWSAYKDAVARATDPRKRAHATARAAALEPRLSYLKVAVPDASQIAGLSLTRNGKPFDAMLWNRALPADGGDYVIAGRAAGHADWQATVHVAIERTTVDLEVPRLAELPPVSSPAGPTTPAAPALPPEPPPAQPDRGDQVGRSSGGVTSRRVIALGVAGVGLVGVTAGVVLGEAARGKQRDAFKLCPDPMQPCFRAEQSTALVTSGHTYALEANLAYGIATAAVIGAAVLWFTGAPGGEPAKHVRVVPRVSPGEAGVVASGSF